MDEELRGILRELGKAIGECISDSQDVNRSIQKIRDQGYSLFLILDSTIGLGKAENGGFASKASTRMRFSSEAPPRSNLTPPPANPAFRMNVTDLSFLKSVGIDPTLRRRRGLSESLGTLSRESAGEEAGTPD